MAKGINHTSDADDDELIKLIELDAADRFDISTSFPLAQAHNVEDDVEENSSVNIDIEDIKEDIVNISSALTLIGTADKSALDYLEETDEADNLHLMTYRNSSEADAEVNVDAVSLLMPDLSNATALDCGNFVDHDEFNMCLNNILSDKDDQELRDCDANGSANVNSGRHYQQQQQQQQWRDVNEVLNIVPLRFQEFATEASITGDDRSASSSSSQMA